MRRREIVSSMSLAAAASIAAPFASRAQAADAPQLPTRYDDFANWLTSAQQAGLTFLRALGADEHERFMRFLGLWAAAMPAPLEPAWQNMVGANAKLEMATLGVGRPFVVSAFRMAPGCILPLHCHPGGGGITFCRSGAVSIQHFDLLDEQPPFSETGARAEVLPVSVTHLTPEHDTWFTPEHANLHQFLAGPEGAYGVEIAVQWEGSGTFSFLRLEEAIVSDRFPARSRLGGVWVGMRLEDAYPGGAG